MKCFKTTLNFDQLSSIRLTIYSYVAAFLVQHGKEKKKETKGSASALSMIPSAIWLTTPETTSTSPLIAFWRGWVLWKWILSATRYRTVWDPSQDSGVTKKQNEEKAETGRSDGLQFSPGLWLWGQIEVLLLFPVNIEKWFTVSISISESRRKWKNLS